MWKENMIMTTTLCIITITGALLVILAYYTSSYINKIVLLVTGWMCLLISLLKIASIIKDFISTGVMSI